MSRLFDHRVREGEQFVWHRKPERLGGREINDQVEFHWLLDRNLGGLCPAQYLIDEISGTPPHARPVRSIGHQTPRFDASKTESSSSLRRISKLSTSIPSVRAASLSWRRSRAA